MTAAGLEKSPLTVNDTQTPSTWQAPTPKFTADRKKHNDWLIQEWALVRSTLQGEHSEATKR